MQPKQNPDYVIGYRRPPERTRFQPGRSGNPSGRPKRPTSFDDRFSTELNTKIFITENGQRRAITKGDAIIKQIVNKAASGDLKMLKLLLENFSELLSKEIPSKAVRPPLRAEDLEDLPVPVLQKMIDASIHGNGDSREIYDQYRSEQKQKSLDQTAGF